MKLTEKGVLQPSELYFHTPSSLAKSMFYYLVMAGSYACDGNYRIVRDNFNCFLLMYVKSGHGAVETGGKNFLIQTGQVAFLNCHEPHGYYTDTGWEIDWIHFDGGASPSYYELISGNQGPVYTLSKTSVIPSLLEAIIASMARSLPVSEAAVSCDIVRMLTELALLSALPEEPSLSGAAPVAAAQAFIQDRYMEKLSLDEIARAANLSSFHFARLFKRETGYAPHEYLIKTRLDKAKLLLSQSELPIKAIAFQTGYSSEAGFVTSFRANTGHTPGEFRSKCPHVLPDANNP